MRPLGFVGRRAPDPLRCPGWIPAFAGMTERGARAPSGLCARRFTGKSAQALRARSAAGAAPAVRVGAWGLLRSGREETSQGPHMKNIRGRVGGPRAAQRARPGWGCGGRSPHRGGSTPHPHPLPRGARGPDGDSTATCGRAIRDGAWGRSPHRGGSTPHPHPLPQGARGPDGDSTATCGRAIRVGAWGRSPHMKEIPRVGGWATSRAARSSGMGRGGAAPTGEGAPLTPALCRKGRGGRTATPPRHAGARSGWGRGGAAPT